jgi:hypothetical protein
MNQSSCLLRNCLSAVLISITLAANVAAAATVDLTQHHADSGISVISPDSSSLQIRWPISTGMTGQVVLDLSSDKPLFRSVGYSSGTQPVQLIATALDPVTTLTIGERDKDKAVRGFRGMVFFENPRERPHQTHAVSLVKNRVRVVSEGSRTTVIIGEASAGSFKGDFRLTFYPNSQIILAETVVATDETLRAILYDTGLSSASPDWSSMVWNDPHSALKKSSVTTNSPATPLAVKGRALVAEGKVGSLAIFPAPHQYFYPLDFANNYGFAWYGRGYSKMPAGFGFGIRQPPEGDKRWVPWFDAPAGTEQHLAVFYFVSPTNAEATLKSIAGYTREDRFVELPGHKTFTSHYHVEHTLDFLRRQKEQQTNGVPRGLEAPGFVTKFKQTGVQIVHLAEFHQGWTPGQKTKDRLPMLKAMHEECARLSDKNFLLLPGEEPNVHLGGHWISFFPKPIYWILNRAKDEPFSEELPGFGTVYHVGSASDVLALMEKENGLMWTAHPRIKSSQDFPDDYRYETFYKSDHFLGGGWKAMPGNLSRDTLGWRSLDLLDDMNQWGQRKQVLGEVDVFEVQPDYELYGHMNINYLKLDTLPRFDDGWGNILKTLRGGKYFTTTGEIVIPRFTVAGQESGATVGATNATVEAQIEWTFPLAFAEIISGDGSKVTRQRIELADTESFGTRTLRTNVNLTGQKWVRFEVWDIAANGAFTQPVWVK